MHLESEIGIEDRREFTYIKKDIIKFIQAYMLKHFFGALYDWRECQEVSDEPAGFGVRLLLAQWWDCIIRFLLPSM